MDLDFSILLNVWPALAAGAATTLKLTGAVLLAATPFGVALALLANSNRPLVGASIASVSWVMRGVPPLLILFFCFFGLPQLGITLEPFASAFLAMTAYMAFYFAEIFRSGLASVPAGQWQAARALGMSPLRTLVRIIIPQAIPAALPGFVSHSTEILKGTALSAAVAVPELTSAARRVFAVTYKPFEIFIAAAIIYAFLDGLLLCIQLIGERWADRRRNRRAG